MGFNGIGPSMRCDNHPNGTLHDTASEMANCVNRFAVGDKVVVTPTDDSPAFDAVVTRNNSAPYWYTVEGGTGEQYDAIHEVLAKV